MQSITVLNTTVLLLPRISQTTTETVITMMAGNCCEKHIEGTDEGGEETIST